MLLSRHWRCSPIPIVAGNTAAHWAAGAGAAAALEVLLEHEADVNLKNTLGDTVLHRAVWRNQVRTARVVDFGSD